MRPTRIAARAAAVAGAAAAFVAAATLLDAIGPELLIDADPAWAFSRLLLTLLLVASAGGAGVAAAGGVYVANRAPAVSSNLEPLDLPRWALAATGAAALLLGACVRFAGLESLPFPLWHDELLVLPQAMALQGSPGDFRDTVRMVLDDGGRRSGTVGVLYLEAFRAALRTFGTTVFGVRFLSAFGGVLSLCTAMLLGRALLPRGGGTLAGLVLAGLRWSLIISRWGWNMIVLAPLLDVATLVALRARRRGRPGGAVLAGALAGSGRPRLPLGLDRGGRARAGAALAVGSSIASLASRCIVCRRLRPDGPAALPLSRGPTGVVPRPGGQPQHASGNAPDALAPSARARDANRAARAVGAAGSQPPHRPRGAPAPSRPARGPARDRLSAGRRAPARRPLRLVVGARRHGPAREPRVGRAALAQRIPVRVPDDGHGGRRRLRPSLVARPPAAAVAAGGGAARRRRPLHFVRAFDRGARAVGSAARHVRRDGRSAHDGGLGRRALGALRAGAAGGEPALRNAHGRHDPAVPDSSAPGGRGRSARRRADRVFRICRPEAPPRDGERVVERVRDAWGKDWAVVFGRRDSGRPGESF